MSMYSDIKEVTNSDEFGKIRDELVEHYHISASAKHTLEPRNDFIHHIIRAYLELKEPK